MRNKAMWAVLSAAVLSLPAWAAEGSLSQLYAPRPPAGSSFIRLINPSAASISAQVADGAAQRLGREQPAGRYAIVRGGRPFGVRIDGKMVIANLKVKPDSFNSLVLSKKGTVWSVSAIDDSSNTQDALKAELRFYNLAEACPAAKLKLANAEVTVFDNVAPVAAQARSINPVAATFSASCGNGRAITWSMPATQPGDHYSLFLTGTAASPQLRGQLSSTEAYGKTP